MTIQMPEGLKRYGGFFAKGLASSLSPSIGKAILMQYFRVKQINVAKMIKCIENDTSLWSNIEPVYQDRLKKLAQKANNLNWLNAEQAIEMLRKEYPAMASLFLGWTKARNWLDRQMLIIRKELKS